MTKRRRGDGGFSLLEVMVALAVLAVSLVLLSQITTSNVRATHHAKMTTVATFLARTKMAAIEDDVLYQGFVDTDQADAGDFAAESRPDFRWTTLIEKIQLPADMAQKAQDANQNKMEEQSGNPLAAMAGFMGGFMTTLIEPIRVGIEESVRRVTVKVLWDEPGRPEQSFEVITFMTDPAKLDLAVNAIGQPPGGSNNQGTGGSGGSGAGGTSGGAAAPRSSTPSGTGTGTSTPAPSQPGGRR
jgi:prepilin-type N-terminal cleavage/methylation domain-containing protein